MMVYFIPLVYKNIVKVNLDGLTIPLKGRRFHPDCTQVFKITRLLPKKRNSDLAGSTKHYFRQCPNIIVNEEEGQHLSKDSSKQSSSSP